MKGITSGYTEEEREEEKKWQEEVKW